MSNEIFFKNVDDNEIIRLEDTNGSYSDWEQPDNTLYLMWVMLHKWVGKKVVCMTWKQSDYQTEMVNLTDVSDSLRNAFINDKVEQVKLIHDKEHCYSNMRSLFITFNKR